MKNTLILLAMLGSLSMSAQKNGDIMKSNNISEIEQFLKTIHPDDYRGVALKNKIIRLKNENWHKQTATPVVIRRDTEVRLPKASTTSLAKNADAEEYKRLMAEDKHEQKTVKLLNQLFDNDITNKQAILLIKNQSDCNMVVKIQGKQNYNLAIPSRGENSIVVNKGQYFLKTNVCEIPYSSGKSIARNMLVTLSKSPAVIR